MLSLLCVKLRFDPGKTLQNTRIYHENAHIIVLQVQQISKKIGIFAQKAKKGLTKEQKCDIITLASENSTKYRGVEQLGSSSGS